MLYFSLQGDFYTGRHFWQPVYPTMWMSFVVIVMAFGLVAGVACNELFRETRLFNALEDAPNGSISKETEQIDRLVDKIRGIRARNKISNENKRRRAAWLVMGFCYLLVSGLTGYHALKRDAWFVAFLTQLYFFGACAGGVGVFWLGRFLCTSYASFSNRRRANEALKALRIQYELVETVYRGAQQRFFEEHPDLKNEESKLPPISPLAAYMVTYPCLEGIEIPKHLLQPNELNEKKNDYGENIAEDQGSTAPPKNTPPPSEAIGPTNEPSVHKKDSLDNPEQLFSTIDTNSDANSERLS